MSKILQNTRVYLSFPMENADSRGWADYFSNNLNELGIRVFNPYKKIFKNDLEETSEITNKLKELRAAKKMDELYEIMSKIVSRDLSLVEKSDFIISLINPAIPMFGAIHELILSYSILKKPAFVQILGGIDKTPLWLCGLIKSKYLYNTKEEILNKIIEINDEKIDISSERWKIIKW